MLITKTYIPETKNPLKTNPQGVMVSLPGVDSTLERLKVKASTSHQFVRHVRHYPKSSLDVSTLSVTFRNISASVFNCVVRVIVGHGKLKAPATFKSRPRTAQLSALAKSMLYCGAAWKVNPQRGGNSVDTQGESREALICHSGDTREIYTSPIIHSRSNALPPQQSIFKRGARILSHSEGALPASANSRPPRPGQSRTVRRVFRCGSIRLDAWSEIRTRSKWPDPQNGEALIPGEPLLKAPLKTRWSIHQDSGFRCEEATTVRPIGKKSRHVRQGINGEQPPHSKSRSLMCLLVYWASPHFKAHYPKREIMAAETLNSLAVFTCRLDRGRCRQSHIHEIAFSMCILRMCIIAVSDTRRGFVVNQNRKTTKGAALRGGTPRTTRQSIGTVLELKGYQKGDLSTVYV